MQPRSCPACGAPTPPAAKFCPACGQRLEDQAAPAPGPQAAATPAPAEGTFLFRRQSDPTENAFSVSIP